MGHRRHRRAVCDVALHLLLFRGEGLVAWIGLLVVVQNIFTSLFNSHLFDFHEGWMYVLGVGVAGGMVLRARAAQACRRTSIGHPAMIAGTASYEMSYQRRESFRESAYRLHWSMNDASFTIDLAQFPDRGA